MPIQRRITPDGRQTYEVEVIIVSANSRILGSSRLVHGSFRPFIPAASTVAPHARDSPEAVVARPGAGQPA